MCDYLVGLWCRNIRCKYFNERCPYTDNFDKCACSD